MNRILILTMAFLFCIAFSTSGQYVKIGNITGESMAKNFVGWSTFDGVTFSMEKPGGGATGQSRRRGSVKVEDIMVTKPIDKASPKLTEALTMGTVFPTATIVFQAGGKPYLNYELKNVMVTSYSLSGSPDDIPTETFSLNYEKIKVTYTEYDKTGKVKGKIEHQFQVEEGH